MAGGSRKNADEALAVALAAGQTVKAAATAAGVSESTAYKRLREDPHFKRRVQELRGEMVATAAGRLADGMASAADVLLKLLTVTNDDLKYKAATKVLELALRVREQSELEERLAEIEARLAGGNPPTVPGEAPE